MRARVQTGLGVTRQRNAHFRGFGLQLVEATPFENGVVLLCYDIEKTDRFRGSR